MQKYKRPPKHKGLRSIPIRNPRVVDWWRWDENTNAIRSNKPLLGEGVTKESFAPAPVEQRLLNKMLLKYESQPFKKLLIMTFPLVKVFLFHRINEYYLVEENYHSRRRYITGITRDGDKLKASYTTGTVRWLYVEYLEGQT